MANRLHLTIDHGVRFNFRISSAGGLVIVKVALDPSLDFRLGQGKGVRSVIDRNLPVLPVVRPTPGTGHLIPSRAQQYAGLRGGIDKVAGD